MAQRWSSCQRWVCVFVLLILLAARSTILASDWVHEEREVITRTVTSTASASSSISVGSSGTNYEIDDVDGSGDDDLADGSSSRPTDDENEDVGAGGVEDDDAAYRSWDIAGLRDLDLVKVSSAQIEPYSNVRYDTWEGTITLVPSVSNTSGDDDSEDVTEEDPEASLPTLIHLLWPDATSAISANITVKGTADGSIRNVTLHDFSRKFVSPFPGTLLLPTKISDLNTAREVAIVMQLEEDDDIIALALQIDDSSYLLTNAYTGEGIDGCLGDSKKMGSVCVEKQIEPMVSIQSRLMRLIEPAAYDDGVFSDASLSASADDDSSSSSSSSSGTSFMSSSITAGADQNMYHVVLTSKYKTKPATPQRREFFLGWGKKKETVPPADTTTTTTGEDSTTQDSGNDNADDADGDTNLATSFNIHQALPQVQFWIKTDGPSATVFIGNQSYEIDGLRSVAIMTSAAGKAAFSVLVNDIDGIELGHKILAKATFMRDWIKIKPDVAGAQAFNLLSLSDLNALRKKVVNATVEAAEKTFEAVESVIQRVLRTVTQRGADFALETVSTSKKHWWNRLAVAPGDGADGPLLEGIHRDDVHVVQLDGEQDQIGAWYASSEEATALKKSKQVRQKQAGALRGDAPVAWEFATDGEVALFEGDMTQNRKKMEAFTFASQRQGRRTMHVSLAPTGFVQVFDGIKQWIIKTFHGVVDLFKRVFKKLGVIFKEVVERIRGVFDWRGIITSYQLLYRHFNDVMPDFIVHTVNDTSNDVLRRIKGWSKSVTRRIDASLNMTSQETYWRHYSRQTKEALKQNGTRSEESSSSAANSESDVMSTYLTDAVSVQLNASAATSGIADVLNLGALDNIKLDFIQDVLTLINFKEVLADFRNETMALRNSTALNWMQTLPIAMGILSKLMVRSGSQLLINMITVVRNFVLRIFTTFLDTLRVAFHIPWVTNFIRAQVWSALNVDVKSNLMHVIAFLGAVPFAINHRLWYKSSPFGIEDVKAMANVTDPRDYMAAWRTPQYQPASARSNLLSTLFSTVHVVLYALQPLFDLVSLPDVLSTTYSIDFSSIFSFASWMSAYPLSFAANETSTNTPVFDPKWSISRKLGMASYCYRVLDFFLSSTQNWVGLAKMAIPGPAWSILYTAVYGIPKTLLDSVSWLARGIELHKRNATVLEQTDAHVSGLTNVLSDMPAALYWLRQPYLPPNTPFFLALVPMFVVPGHGQAALGLQIASIVLDRTASALTFVRWQIMTSPAGRRNNLTLANT